jgi:hypothetical protein
MSYHSSRTIQLLRGKNNIRQREALDMFESIRRSDISVRPATVSMEDQGGQSCRRCDGANLMPQMPIGLTAHLDRGKDVDTRDVREDALRAFARA